MDNDTTTSAGTDPIVEMAKSLGAFRAELASQGFTTDEIEHLVRSAGHFACVRFFR